MENNPEKESTRITIAFPTNAYFMSGIRDFTLTMVKNMTNFEEQWAFRFQSIIDELCNNAIEFGSSPGKEIKTIFQYFPGEALEVIVEDSGTGKSKMKAMELQKLVEERNRPDFMITGLRGRGLAKIVAEWSDVLKFEDMPSGGIRVTVRKNLQSDKQEKFTSRDSSTTPKKFVLTS